ncbi:MAG: hypothetical protein LBC79_10075 [Deltaproteobacteria bacterium]|jgi:hypothetical protein|nr:hypothetical protein [Deltaproteobacteria bacterium]
MRGWQKRIYFDRQDRELLGLINRLLSTKSDAGLERKLFDASLHPHGIMSLAAPREMRIAMSVTRLLNSLEVGQAEDRLHALQSLYDVVLTTAKSALRRNTARVLIQTMKDLVRAYGDERKQLMLAHDFRQAATGSPRIVRRLLHRYHLLEMPESWSQLAFDHHVHDANTKGRKTPTHLIMDAWLKGIRYLTVIYYNYVEDEAARELMQAANIMGISVRVGLEFACPFRGRYVHFIWVPQGFTDAKSFLEFLAEAPVQHLMRKGREASAWQQRYIHMLLENWNTRHRLKEGERFAVDLPPLPEERFREFVGAGQASLLHLAECIHLHCRPPLLQRLAALQRERAAAAGRECADIEEQIQMISEIEPSYFADAYLSPEHNPDLPDPGIPGDSPDVPDILRLSPIVLLDWLAGMRVGHSISLNLAGLSPEDVLELLWTCQGLITHLEIFNLKEWLEGKLVHLKTVNQLQLAVNTGSAPRLKQLIREMISGFECERDEQTNEERCMLFRAILRNIPTLQDFYKTTPLRTSMGTDSTSRSRKTLGMGLVFKETLPPHVVRQGENLVGTSVQIPVSVDVLEQIQYRRQAHSRLGERLPRLIRKIPGCRRFGHVRVQTWLSHSATAKVGDTSNVMLLGGSIVGSQKLRAAAPDDAQRSPKPHYLDTKLANTLKVLAGIVPAFCSFQYTQDWWLLAWFGPLFWFGITGFRNIMQSVLGGGGIFHTTLLRWNDYVSWTRLCDSLMYTGFSVLLLELIVRSLLLEHTLGVTVAQYPVIVYAVIAIINGLYICSHNLYRGLPKEAAIGNIFRSILAIPVAVLYNFLLYELLALAGVDSPYQIIQPAAAVIAKMASETVAALIEGFGDRQTNMRMRHWDYTTKLARVFDAYARLEVLFPEKDVPAMLHKPVDLLKMLADEAGGMEVTLIINALDLMHFWLYLPRAQDALRQLARQMSQEERVILFRSQLVLVCEHEVSRLFVNDLVGRNFGRALAFYLDRHNEYLRAMAHLCRAAPADE